MSFLKNFDFDIYAATNGKEAVKMAGKFKPDLILMDLKMPLMDGYEATSTIKSDETLKNIPIIAFTASATKEEKDKILAAGFDHFLRKPIAQKDLTAELMHYLKYKKPKESVPENFLTGQEMLDENLTLRLPELMEILNGKFRTKWESVRTTFVLGEITSFAKEIQKIGKEYQIAQLTEWSEMLEEQALNFDMENLPGTLKQYDKMVARLGNFLKR